MKILTMENTKKALVEYYDDFEAREKAWKDIITVEDFDACVAADECALRKVQEAYYLDTCDRNSRDNCLMVDIKFMESIVDFFEKNS